MFAVMLMGAFFVNQNTATASEGDCTPQAAFTSYFVLGSSDSLNAQDASWVTAELNPGSPYYQVDSRTVVDQEAYDETVVDSEAIPSQHYSLKGNSGIGKDEVPVFPADYWQANSEQEPPGHYNSAQKPDGSLYQEGDSGLHYTSHGSEGLRDWFYFQAAVPAVTHIVHHDAVTHEEFQYAQDHPAVDCPPVDLPKDATASVGTTPADCDSDGSATYASENASLVGEFETAPGDHVATFVADQGHEFADGSTTLEVSYTVAAATGNCPQPPCTEKCGPPHHNPPSNPPHHNPPNNPPHNNPPKHNAPPALTVKSLPNAGLDNSSTNYLPIGLAGLLIVSGAALLFRKHNA
jgi:LPXTG-motif cell wall-anchored protein